jgi:integrase
VLRVYLNQKLKYIPIGFDVMEKDWKQEADQKVKRSDLAHYRKNQIISNYLERASQIQNDHFDKDLSMDEFIKLMKLERYNSQSFYDYVEQRIPKLKNELREQTIQSYYKHLSKMKRFRPELTFSDITEDFIHEYKAYMIEKLDNKPITYNKSLEFIRKNLNAAQKEGKITANPFRNIKLKNYVGEGQPISTEEINKLQRLLKNGNLKDNEKRVLTHFLFSCYTGLRIGDIKNLLRFKHLKQIEGKYFLELSMNKTEKPVIIPLIKQAVELLPEIGLPEQPIFKMYEPQYTNKKLKQVLQMAFDMKGRKITFHSGRKTCSNLLYKMGVPDEIRIKIIGDTKKVLHDHYTEIDVPLLIQAMNKIEENL